MQRRLQFTVWRDRSTLRCFSFQIPKFSYNFFFLSSFFHFFFFCCCYGCCCCFTNFLHTNGFRFFFCSTHTETEIGFLLRSVNLCVESPCITSLHVTKTNEIFLICFFSSVVLSRYILFPSFFSFFFWSFCIYNR